MNHCLFRARTGTRLLGGVLLACALGVVAACDSAVSDSNATPSAAAVSAPGATPPAAPAIDATPRAAAPAEVATPVVPVKAAPVAEPVAAPVAKEIEWFKGTLDEALVEAKKQNKLVFIDFWTTWCGWCKKLDRDVYTEARVIAEMNAHYVCLSIDAETKIGVPLARRYSVSGYPTLLMLTTDGLVRERIAGYKPPDIFLQIVTAASKPR